VIKRVLKIIVITINFLINIMPFKIFIIIIRRTLKITKSDY
jgi:hypothetical protein